MDIQPQHNSMIDGVVLRFVKHQVNNFLFPVVAGYWTFILQKAAR